MTTATPAYVDALRTVSSRDEIVRAAWDLLKIREGVVPEVPLLLDLLREAFVPESRCMAIRCASLGLVMSLGERLNNSLLDDLDDQDHEPLRLLSAIARWNAGDPVIPPLIVNRIMVNHGLANDEPVTGMADVDRFRHVRQVQEQLGIRNYPWRVEVTDDPEAFVSFLCQLSKLVGSQIILDRIHGDCSGDAGLLHAILDRLESSGGSDPVSSLLQLLGRTGGADPESIPRLADILDSDEPGHRQAAVSAFGNITVDKPTVARWLMRALGDRNGGVRAAAVASLGRLGHQSSEVTAAVAQCLASPGAAEVLEAAGEAAARLKIPAEKLDAAGMLAHLRSKFDYTRHRGAWACGVVGLNTPAIRSELHRLLADTKVYVAVSAAVALWKLTRNTVDTIPVLERGMSRGGRDNPDNPTEQQVFAALAEMGSAAAAIRTTLERYVRHDDQRWYRAAETLWRVGSARADHDQFRAAYIDLLVTRLTAGYPGAAILLGELGAEAAAALPALERESDSRDPRTRYHTTRAVGLIRTAVAAGG